MGREEETIKVEISSRIIINKKKERKAYPARSLLLDHQYKLIKLLII